MANVVVSIVNVNLIKVEFNDYYPTYYPISIAYYNRNDIEKVELYSDYVSVHVIGGLKDWALTYDNTYTGEDYFIVDEVDGDSSIVDNDDLASKIAALIVA